MSKYKVKNTSILHNGVLQEEGSIVELNETQAKKLEGYVELQKENKTPAKQQTSQKQENSKQNKNKKTETTPETANNKETDGGKKDGE